MIQMTRVYKTYPGQITALSDINLTISPGEFAFVHGNSGSGKTTLLRILFCAEKPTSGDVSVNGFLITQHGFSKVYRLRRTIGIVFQDFRLLRDRTVGENIAFALEVTGHPQKEISTKVAEILMRFGLLERKKDAVVALSAGEQQRVAIARGVVNDPPLLLVDEPTCNLDPQMTDEVMRIFSDLHRRGTTILLATQDRSLVRQYPHRIIRLARGTQQDAAGEGE